jgi:hypothetical protein
MINNYTKAKIFPAPVKKKYSRTHLMLLIMIYHLKSVLSIKDIGIIFQSALSESNKMKQEKMIVSAREMTLTLHGMRGSYVYTFENQCELRRYREIYRDGADRLVPEASAPCGVETMIEHMNACDILRWDGFYGKHPKNVSDGIMFRFEATVNGGQTIFAEGSANFPKDYREFVRALDAMLAEFEKDGSKIK